MYKKSVKFSLKGALNARFFLKTGEERSNAFRML